MHNAASDIRAAEYTGDQEKLRVAKSDHVDNLRILAQALDLMIENGMTPPGKPPAWIDTIRALSLSRYPDRLQVFTGPDDEPRSGDAGIMRPVTEQDVTDWEAAAERNTEAQDDCSAAHSPVIVPIAKTTGAVITFATMLAATAVPNRVSDLQRAEFTVEIVPASRGQ